MKKIIYFCFIGIILIFSGMAFGGCGQPSVSPSNTQTGATLGTPQPTIEVTSNNVQKTFTIDELKNYDGQNGRPAYVAVSGVVYDVSALPQFSTGSHKGHMAGTDMTAVMQNSPHGNSVLAGLPIVGKLK
jgi:predicted heme/steroid binding protein